MNPNVLAILLWAGALTVWAALDVFVFGPRNLRKYEAEQQAITEKYKAIRAEIARRETINNG